MKSISGDISLMTLPDIMQWAEANRKTGTLTVRRSDTSKSFYVQDGKIIFISSQKPGERLGEFFTTIGHIDRKQMEHALMESRRLGVPFTGYLISEKIIDLKSLEQVMSKLAEVCVSDVLKWEDGAFEFNDSLPPLILNGPVTLNIAFIVFHAVKTYDESHTERIVDKQELLTQIARQIAEGNIDIPPIPDIMHKLNQALQKDETSIPDVVKIIMSDQILTSKILKVVNSAFYSPPSQITSLQQAIIFLGLKSIVSVVTVHALSGFTSRNINRVKEVLRHSLTCAFIAKKIASFIRMDPEEAFVCGLLHDIGKTVIINLTEFQDLTEEDRSKLLNDYHEGVGFMLTSKWNFSEVVRYSVKFHHNPEKAKAHKKAVETVYLANIIANSTEQLKAIPEHCSIDFEVVTRVYEELDNIHSTVTAII